MTSIKLPGQALKAIGSGREIQVRRTGVPIVLLYHSRNTAELAREINTKVRDIYPNASDLLIASIIDMHGVPKLMRGVTEKMIAGEYEKESARLSDDQDPADIIIILVDWNGKITAGAGFEDTDKQLGLIVLDADGNLVDIYQGEEPVQNAIEIVGKAITN